MLGIRRLQAVLAKVALLLGVEIHLGVAFNALDEPRDPGGFWRVRTSPHSPRVTSLAVDVLVGAEGKHVTVPGIDTVGIVTSSTYPAHFTYVRTHTVFYCLRIFDTNLRILEEEKEAQQYFFPRGLTQ